MKKTILIIALSALTYFANGQKVPMSSNGYWTVETSKQAPKTSVIRFYNLKNELVYQETITGKKVRVNNNDTRVALNNTLQAALDGKKHDQPILAMEPAK